MPLYYGTGSRIKAVGLGTASGFAEPFGALLALTPTPTPTPTLTPNPHTNPNGGTCLPKPLRTLYLRAGGAGLELGGLELAVF